VPEDAHPTEHHKNITWPVPILSHQGEVDAISNTIRAISPKPFEQNLPFSGTIANISRWFQVSLLRVIA